MTSEIEIVKKLVDTLKEFEAPCNYKEVMCMEYEVQIISSDTDKIVEVIHAKTERIAEKIERGININLNHDDYYTKIEQTK